MTKINKPKGKPGRPKNVSKTLSSEPAVAPVSKIKLKNKKSKRIPKSPPKTFAELQF